MSDQKLGIRQGNIKEREMHFSRLTTDCYMFMTTYISDEPSDFCVALSRKSPCFYLSAVKDF